MSKLISLDRKTVEDCLSAARSALQMHYEFLMHDEWDEGQPRHRQKEVEEYRAWLIKLINKLVKKTKPVKKPKRKIK